MRTIPAVVLALALSPFAAYGNEPAAGDSIYQLATPLTDQEGKRVALDFARGHPVLLSMFYASCSAACPVLISQIQRVEGALDPETASSARVLLVSFDPEHDKPAVLAAAAKLHGVSPRWTLASTPAAQVRSLAAVLGIKYRKLADGSFNHSSVLVVLDGHGLIRARFEGAEAAPAVIAQALRDAAAEPKG